MKRLLLLLHSESYRVEDFVTAARRLAVDLVVGSDKQSVLDQLVPDRALHLDFLDREQGQSAIVSFHNRKPLDAIVAAEDAGVPLAAQASEALRLPTNPLESALSSSNKAVFREIQQAAGLETPSFRVVPLNADPEAEGALTEYPCVLKPLFLNASRGVIRADNPAGFIAAFERIRELLADPALQRQGGALAGKILVEGFIPGAEVALEGMVHQGEFQLLAFFDKPDPMDGPYFEETLFITPSRHPKRLQQESLRVVQAGVRALGLRTGPVHAELRLHGNTAVLLELATRSIGGHCSRSLRFGAGMSLEELILRQALGLAPGDAEREAKPSGVMMIPIPTGGILRGVDGLASARSVAGITGVEITIPVGRAVHPLPEGNQYLGFIFASGATPAAVESALRAAHRCVKLDIRPGTPEEEKTRSGCAD